MCVCMCVCVCVCVCGHIFILFIREGERERAERGPPGLLAGNALRIEIARNRGRKSEMMLQASWDYDQ
jgi:hypothetical protein